MGTVEGPATRLPTNHVEERVSREIEVWDGLIQLNTQSSKCDRARGNLLLIFASLFHTDPEDQQRADEQTEDLRA